jgi:hypothetical protein
MGALLLTVLVPTVLFGLFALLAVRFGAESRPYFDERPVVDDRPNWFPIAGSAPGEDDEEPGDGEPVAAPAERAPAPRRQPRLLSPASPSSAATRPSGV